MVYVIFLVKCDPKCGTGVYAHAGTCQENGRCLCFWGWTGPNAKYTTDNKILVGTIVLLMRTVIEKLNHLNNLACIVVFFKPMV